MREAVIVSYARTPIGRAKKGSLKDTRPEEFSAEVLKDLVRRTPGLAPDMVDDVIRTIMQTCRTGEIGDGRVFVLPVEQGYNIRTGERDVL